MNFFLILMIIVGIFYIYIAFEIKTYIALIYPVILGLIIPSLKFYSISFDNNIIQVKMLFYKKRALTFYYSKYLKFRVYKLSIEWNSYQYHNFRKLLEF